MDKKKLNGIRKVIQELNSEERTRMYQGVYYDFVKDEVQLKKDKKKEFLPKELQELLDQPAIDVMPWENFGE